MQTNKSERFQAGEVLPGGYTLTEKLSKHKFFMSTWRATNEQGEDVVLNIYSTTTFDSDHGFHPHDLHQQFQQLLPDIEAIKQLPPHPALAPLLDYYYTPESPVLLLVRNFYLHRLEDHYPPGQVTQERLLDLFDQLASAFDFLNEQLPDVSFFITPEHLMMDGDQPVVLDYGLEDILKVVEYSYVGARPVTARWRYEVGWYPGPFTENGRVPALFALGSLYYYFRTGSGVFENPGAAPDQFFYHWINWGELTAYRDYGTLPARLDDGSAEMQTVKQALTGDFQSCTQFIAQLR